MGGFKEYDQYDAMGLAELIDKGDITAAELCEAAIERIEKVNPRIIRHEPTQPVIIIARIKFSKLGDRTITR